jgi:hypothetical protein
VQLQWGGAAAPGLTLSRLSRAQAVVGKDLVKLVAALRLSKVGGAWGGAGGATVQPRPAVVCDRLWV